MELVNGYESLLALNNLGALLILDASFKFALGSYLVSGEPWSTVRMEQRAFGLILCLLRKTVGPSLSPNGTQQHQPSEKGIGNKEDQPRDGKTTSTSTDNQTDPTGTTRISRAT